jgi:hypothetical protein
MKQKIGKTNRRSLKLIGLTIFLLIVIQIPLSAQESNVAGKWERYINGATMTFVLDEKLNYTVDFDSDGNIEVNGSYKIEGNIITFNDKPGGLASPDPGVYTFVIEKDKITFVIKEDPSEGRSGLLAGSWTKAKD